MQLLTTSRDGLLAPLQSVAGIIEKRHTLPILSNVLIERQGETLTMLATDIDIQIRTATRLEDDGPTGEITVAARKLQDILRALPDGKPVSLAVDENRLILKAGKSRFQLQTMPAAEYPRLNPPETTSARFSISQREFRAQLSQVSFAMAAQDIRYYLNGLLLVVEGNLLRMVATDGHRLAYASRPIEGNYPRAEIILPRKTVLELSRQLVDSDDPLEVALAENQAVFRFGPTELITKLIDGRFPDYERVIPQHHPKLIPIARLPLLASLQRAAILSNEKFRGVRLVFADNSLTIISTNAEQEEAHEEIEIEYSEETLDVGFNVSYLIDVLNHCDTENIEWRLNDSNSSMLITLPGRDDFKSVVMPMRI